MIPLTPSQSDCLLKARETLGEQFDACVIVVAGSTDTQECHWTARSGGFAIAQGLLRIGILKLDEEWNTSLEKNDE